MKTKTITKKDKAKLVAAEKAAIATLTKEFNELRKAGDYAELGNIFWPIFLTADRNTKFYKAADKLWLKLDDEEMEMCG